MFDHIYANYFSYSLPYWISPIICTRAYFPPFILTFLNFCIPSTCHACIPFLSMLACLYFCHFAILNSANPASLHPGILEFLQHCYCFSIFTSLHFCMLACLHSCILVFFIFLAFLYLGIITCILAFLNSYILATWLFYSCIF